MTQSKQYNVKETQEKYKYLWEQHKIYHCKNDQREIFSIDTPPPTVSGNLHIGHIFSYTQTDIIARYERMCGKNVFYPFGFDDNGLPTERYVEKLREISSHQVGRPAFIDMCLEETQKAAQIFSSLWKTIGLSVDWRCCYSTISKEVQKISQQSFIELYKKGFIYRKAEPALFCTFFRTSVAQAELEDVEKESLFATLKFTCQETNEVIHVATTRAEMLFSCVCIFVHPEDVRFSHLIGKHAQVPLINAIVPIMTDDSVIPEKGTGIVMCCTFGDSLDVQWFKKYNLEYKQSIGIDGKMTANTEFLAGLSVKDARTKILSLLEEKGFIIEKKTIKHMVATYERSKKEIEYVMIPQWFVSILKHKETFLDLANAIEWRPTHMKHRYIDWVKNLQWDWCISRQRFFGIPFPVWYDEKGNVILPDDNQLPIDPINDKPKNYNGTVVPDYDVMDTWNTSSLTPLICFELYKKHVNPYAVQKDFISMSMRPQAHDIIRTWAFDTIVKVWMHQSTIPWKEIDISGHVLTSGKDKISKSKNNALSNPLELIEKYSADAVRYWTSSTKLGTDTLFAEDQLKNGSKLVMKLWNAGQFVGLYKSDVVTNSFTNPFVVWMINECQAITKKYHEYLKEREFSLALELVENSFWKKFCDDFLEIIKPYIFKPELFSDKSVKEVCSGLGMCFEMYLSLFSPYLIYVCEELYQTLYQRDIGRNEFKSIHANIFKSITLLNNDVHTNELCSKTECAMNIMGLVRKAKTNAQVSLKYEFDTLYLSDEYAVIKNDEEIATVLKHVCSVKYIVFGDHGMDIVSLERGVLHKVNMTNQIIIL